MAARPSARVQVLVALTAGAKVLDHLCAAADAALVATHAAWDAWMAAIEEGLER